VAAKKRAADAITAETPADFSLDGSSVTIGDGVFGLDSRALLLYPLEEKQDTSPTDIARRARAKVTRSIRSSDGQREILDMSSEATKK